MCPYITIFGHTFSTYVLCAASGVLACLLWLFLTRKKRTQNEGETERLILFSCAGAVIGSKILYLLTVLPQLWSDIGRLSFADFLTEYMESGFVFYGGVYGAVITAAVYMHSNHMDIWEEARVLTPCIPLFHVFGRIGCFLTGCCYGAESEIFGVVFTDALSAPNGVPLVPIQLIEAFCEAVIFMFLWYMMEAGRNGRMVFSLWLIAYGTVRFIDEFFRGDAYRGFVGILSISQWISIASVAFGVIVLYSGQRDKRPIQKGSD